MIVVLGFLLLNVVNSLVMRYHTRALTSNRRHLLASVQAQSPLSTKLTPHLLSLLPRG